MNSKPNTRNIVLVVIVIAMLVMVLRDRSTASAESGGEVSLRQSQQDASGVTRSIEAMLEQRTEWESAHESAQQAWADAMETIIKAPSVNVAESSLRAVLESEMRDAGLTLSVSSPMPRRTPIEGEPLRVIGLTLDFDVTNPDALYTLLDRIENTSAPLMEVSDLEIRGPGRTGRSGLHVKMDVSAMAWLGDADPIGGNDG